MGEGRKESSPAIVLRSSGTVLGFHFQSVSSTSFGFAATPPIPGKIMLDWIWLAARMSPSTTVLFTLDLRLGNVVPTSLAEVRAGEAVLPYVSSQSGAESMMSWGMVYGVPAMPIGLVVPMNGRRFMGAFYNSSAGTSTFHVHMGVHRVIGGEKRGSVDLLGGEYLEWR